MSGSNSGRKHAPKLLSPIRNFEGVVGVIRAGADEVYCGVTIRELRKFWLDRGSMCEVPNYDELGRIVKYAHDHGVEVLLTINERFMTEVIEKSMRDHIYSCLDKEVDAIIVGNVGILSMIKEIDANIPLYASTYMCSMNNETVEFLRKLGFRRVVLERHLTVPEISEIVQHSKVDIEIFVHGPGCSNFNVDCYQFHYSECPKIGQAILTIDGIEVPCRLPFEVYDVDNSQTMLDKVPIQDAFEYCSLCQLPELIQTGVIGFKIADRCIDEKYQEETTRIYRELTDMIIQNRMEDFQEKLRLYGKKFIPLPTTRPYLNLQELCCEHKRCYYSPLFLAQYRQPISWRTWTKNRLKFRYIQGTRET